MNIFLHDTNEIRLPPEEVRLTKVQVTPQPNGRQVKVLLELTPFMKRPNIEVRITNRSGREVGHTSILETMLHKLEFTMHLRQVEPDDELRMETTVYYQKLPEPSATPVEVPLPDPTVVDHHAMTFSLPGAKP
jgi:hypothetical protein